MTDDGSPFGIVTETGVILTSYRRRQPLEEISARVATTDLVDHFGEVTSELSEIRRNRRWPSDSL